MRSSLLIALVSMLLLLGALPAAADALDSKVAAARGSALPVDGALDRAAQAAAQRQATAGTLSHSSLSGLGCSAAGEVVGYGPSVDVIWVGFQNSSSHWSIIKKAGWTSMGTGIATGGDGAIYVSIIFCAGAAAPAPAPSSPPPSNAGGSSTQAAKPAPQAAPAVERARTYTDFMHDWLDAMSIIAVTEFGAMPPPVATDDDLLAMTPVVV